MPQLRANGLTLEYDSVGEGPAILLISGLGVPMTRWAEPFREILAAQGFRVIRFDNRDVGLSTHLHGAPVPDFAALAAAVARGERPAVPYTLDDMAADTIGLLDALGIERAHLAGRSMGGMIVQLVAAGHPRRVLSLAAIMSSTGNPALPRAAPQVMAAMARPAPDPAVDEAGFLAHSVAFARLIAGPGFPFDETTHRAQALAEARRSRDPAGFARQIAAIAVTGDLRPRLAAITAPTLVVHGADDPLVPAAAGRDIAAGIADAELMIVEGMGHDLPPALHSPVADAILRNIRRTKIL
ncbi:alpha/beta fold hydrolase [Inquilinus limosus]|uniref:Alpha/beta hydrolase n=1 Tax=Inquilinus limosus TaxID=171674 RepID=A0A211ZLQ9_9PROT|nr:alpha/beta hydrolase [Inquilinus limosus]OWJ66180.1 alpha/beta hydrolase [Inquilinus limosus]